MSYTNPLDEIRRAREASWFQDRDRELIDGIRRRLERLDNLEALEQALQVPDHELPGMLAQLGIAAETLPVLTLVPMIQVAWADQRIQPEETALLLEAAAAAGIIPDSPAGVALAGLLEAPPSPELVQVAYRSIWALLSAAPAGDVDEALEDLASLASRMARVTHRLLGPLGYMGRPEAQAVEDVARRLRALAEAHADDPPRPMPPPPFESRVHAAGLLVGELEALRDADPVLLVVDDGGAIVAQVLAESLGEVPVLRTGLESDRTSLLGHLAHFRHRANDQLLTFGAAAGGDQAHRLRSAGEQVPHDAHASAPPLGGRIVVLIDDGVIGDQVLRANVEDLRRQAPAQLWLVAPVLPRGTVDVLRSEVDRIITLHTPEAFGRPEDWYESERASAPRPRAAFVSRWEAGAKLLPALTRWQACDAVVIALHRPAAPVAQVVAHGLGGESWVRRPGRRRGPLLAGRLSDFRGRAGRSMLSGESDPTARMSRRLESALGHPVEGLMHLPEVKGRTVLIVDDGLSPDQELRELIEEVRAAGPAGLVLAAPVLPRPTVDVLSSQVDALVTLIEAESFGVAEDWYAA